MMTVILGASAGCESVGRTALAVLRESGSTAAQPDVDLALMIGHRPFWQSTDEPIYRSYLPAAAFSEKVAALGLCSGTPIDPCLLEAEIRRLEDAGGSISERLIIDERALVDDFSHVILQFAMESARLNGQEEANQRYSSGPSLLDEVGQWQIFFDEFLGSEEEFRRKMRHRLERARQYALHVFGAGERWPEFRTWFSRLRQSTALMPVDWPVEFCLGEKPFTFHVEPLIDLYWAAGQRLTTAIGSVRDRALSAESNGRGIVAEFANSVLEDKRLGNTRQRAQGHVHPAEASVSAGVPLAPTNTVAVVSLVEWRRAGEVLRTRLPDGHPMVVQWRRSLPTRPYGPCGWFDAVQMAETLRLIGFDELVFNDLDLLSSPNDPAEPISICVGYRLPDGSEVTKPQGPDHRRRDLAPILAVHTGWNSDAEDPTNFWELPEPARRFVADTVCHIIRIALLNGWDGKLPQVRCCRRTGGFMQGVPSTQALLRKTSTETL